MTNTNTPQLLVILKCYNIQCTQSKLSPGQNYGFSNLLIYENDFSLPTYNCGCHTAPLSHTEVAQLIMMFQSKFANFD